MIGDDAQLELLKLLVSALGGAGLVKIIDKLLPSSDRKIIDNTAIRKELWERQEDLEHRLEERQRECDAKINEIQEVLDEWRSKYFELMEQYHLLKAENHKIREDNHLQLSRLSAMKIEIQRMEGILRKLGVTLRDEMPPVASGPTNALPGSGPSILKDSPEE